MNKFLLTLLCTGSLMTLSGCGKSQEAETKVETTEVAVNEAAVEEVKKEATEINVDSAVVVEAAVAEEKSAEVATPEEK